MDYKARITRISIAPHGEPTFSSQCTHLEIDDESAGEYVTIKQQHDDTEGEMDQMILIEPDMWPAFRDSIETLMAEIGKNEKP